MKMHFEALSRPVTDTELAMFPKTAQYSRVAHANHTPPVPIYTWIARIWVVFVVVTVTATIVWGLAMIALTNPDTMWLSLGVAGVLLVAVGVFVLRTRRKHTLKLLRLAEFTAANKLEYTTNISNPFLPGLIFQQGHSRHITEQLTSQASKMEIGNFRYTVNHGKSSTTYNWGYIAVKLERRVPHMLLDSKRNNMSIFGMELSNLPVMFKKDQVLKLEGDFNNYFTLYAPKQYERDALYILTPDLMALLIDNTAPYDVEAVDDTLFVYSPRAFNLTDRATMERVFAIITTVGDKTIDRTDYYADERVGNRAVDAVDSSGRRLRHGVPKIVIIIGIVYLVYFIVQVVVPFMNR